MDTLSVPPGEAPAFHIRFLVLFLGLLAVITAGICWKFVAIAYKTLTRRGKSVLSDLPGPKSRGWLLDHGPDIFDMPLGRRIADWINEREYPEGLMHFFGLFGAEYIVPTDPRALQDILSTNCYDYEKPTGAKRYLAMYFANGLPTQEQEVHKAGRKVYAAAFNQRAVDKAKPWMTAKVARTVDAIARSCEKQGSSSTVIPITPMLNHIGLDTLGYFALGTDLETTTGKHFLLANSMRTMVNPSGETRLLFFWLNLAPTWLRNIAPLKMHTTLLQTNAAMTGAVTYLVQQRLSQLREGEEDDDYVASLVQSGNYEESDAVAQVLIILMGGFEAVPGSLSWVFYNLARYPDIQTRLRDEISRARKSDTLDETAYEKLPLLNGVVMETVRLHMPFTLLLRRAIRHTTVNGRFIPAGTYVSLSPLAFGRARHLWGPDAATFNPDRWIEGSGTSQPWMNSLGGAATANSLLSFSYGTRSCPGRGVTLALMRRLTAHLVEAFDISLLDEREVKPVGVLTTGAPVDFRLRFTKL